MLPLSTTEQRRLIISKSTETKKKSSLGQFFTPERLANFVVSLFPSAQGDCYLLDAGAGIGSLSEAFLDKWVSGEGFYFRKMVLDAFEIDSTLHAHINQTFAKYRTSSTFILNVKGQDFIQAAVDSLCGDLFTKPLPKYTHVILNPPYKKIANNSAYRLALRKVDIETVNLYSAFVALALLLTVPNGQLVALIPRSFCNGPYYKPFRGFILKHAAIRHIHLFESRNRAFKDDNVLQENIIIRLEREGTQGFVKVTKSTDDTFFDLSEYNHSFNKIVYPDDIEQFIHIPTSIEKNTIEQFANVCHSLNDLGIKVSTGPVVDFRLKEYLCAEPESGSVPLLYPAHLVNNGVIWPIIGMKKPNSIKRNEHTEKWLYPNGWYCVVRRFSSKEEKRRIVAYVVSPEIFPDVEVLGFENHLNLFHINKQGFPKVIAYGLATFLNTTAVDEHFRSFNGHTQVNATDLRLIKYPSYDLLVVLGEWAMAQSKLTQSMIDAKLESLKA